MVDWLRNKWYARRLMWAIRLLEPMYPNIFIHTDKDDTIKTLVFASTRETLDEISDRLGE